MAYLICPADIDFSPLPHLISTGKVIPMKKGCTIGMYLHVHVRYIQTLHVHGNLYFKPSKKHVRKVVGGFGKRSCVSTGVRKPGNTYASPTAMI